MRLIKARIRGIGRLVDTSINLDSRVVAIVGPNEAGKTTLLKALAHLDSRTALPASLRSRAVDVTDETVTVEVTYELEEGDLSASAISELHEPPTRLTVMRSASGNLQFSAEPEPVYKVSGVRAAAEQLIRVSDNATFERWIDPASPLVNLDDPPREVKARLKGLVTSVDAAITESGTRSTSDIADAAQELLDGIVDTEESRVVREPLDHLLSWTKRPNPSKSISKMLYDKSPDLILFTEDERELRSSYLFDDNLVSETPSALANIANLAGLDLVALLELVRAGDNARRRTTIVRANSRLNAVFKNAWKQSELSVQFDLDGDQLRIELQEDGDFVTVFDERSAGLRMFVALAAFLRARNSNRPAVLLIDEAESHLHIDAQADLVNMFVAQEYAAKIVYTTHSPACLPPDLGCGIRTVAPRSTTSQVSDVRNGFWQGGGSGYSSLMLAMGAAAAGFTPARFVVFAEGATEMILLPTLLRKAGELNSIPFQVAPGLSEVPKDFLPELDLEGSRVAYLVDGDEGGRAVRQALLAQAVPGRLVVELGSPGIENLLDPSAYHSALSALLPECNRSNGQEILQLPNPEGDISWANMMSSWIERRGFKMPSKVAVANWLVQNGKAIPSDAGAEILQNVYRELLLALKLK